MATAELCFLTGEHRNTILGRFKPGGDWRAAGLLIGGKLYLPVSAWNGWLDERRVSMEGPR